MNNYNGMKNDTVPNNAEKDKKNIYKAKIQLNIKKINIDRLKLPFLNEFLIQKIFGYFELNEIIQMRLVCYSIKKLITNWAEFWFPIYWKITHKKVRNPKKHYGFMGANFMVSDQAPIQTYCLRYNRRVQLYDLISTRPNFASDPNNFYLCTQKSHGVFEDVEINWSIFDEGENYLQFIFDAVYKKKREAKGKDSIESKYKTAVDRHQQHVYAAQTSLKEVMYWKMYVDEAQRRGHLQ